MGAAWDRSEERIGAEPAERQGEPFERVVVHALTGKREHVMIEPRGANRGDGCAIEWCR